MVYLPVFHLVELVGLDEYERRRGPIKFNIFLNYAIVNFGVTRNLLHDFHMFPQIHHHIQHVHLLHDFQMGADLF